MVREMRGVLRGGEERGSRAGVGAGRSRMVEGKMGGRGGESGVLLQCKPLRVLGGNETSMFILVGALLHYSFHHLVVSLPWFSLVENTVRDHPPGIDCQDSCRESISQQSASDKQIVSVDLRLHRPVLRHAWIGSCQAWSTNFQHALVVMGQLAMEPFSQETWLASNRLVTWRYRKWYAVSN